MTIIRGTIQLNHCYIEPKSGLPGFYCTFVYTFNERSRRVELWNDLKSLITLDPWLLCGDFNCVMNAEERIGSLVMIGEMMEELHEGL